MTSSYELLWEPEISNIELFIPFIRNVQEFNFSVLQPVDDTTGIYI
jgi:hypothetical protein